MDPPASDAAAHEGDVDTDQPTDVDMNTKVNPAAVAGTAAAGTSTRPAPTTLWQRAKHGWPARYPLVQFPNLPLLVAVGGLLVAGMADGAVHDMRGFLMAERDAPVKIESEHGCRRTRVVR